MAQDAAATGTWPGVDAGAWHRCAVAGNLSFLDKSLVSNFKEQDMKLLMESVDKALDSSDPRATRQLEQCRRPATRGRSR